MKHINKNGEVLETSDYVLVKIDSAPFWKVINCKSGKSLKISVDHDGYMIVCINFNTRKKICGLHRLILSNFDPEGYFTGAKVKHIDDNKLNNKLENLKWTTHKSKM